MKFPIHPRPSVRPRYLIGSAVLATSLVAGAFIGYALPATASTSDSEATAPPATVVEGGETFVTSTGVDASWSAITSSITQHLPAGVSWPSDAPAFFDPSTDGTKDLYEPGLFATIAARFWRCAWLDSDLDGQRSGNEDTQRAAEAALADFASVSGSSSVATDKYLQLIKAGAEENGVSPQQFEFSIDCGIYTKEGFAR